MSASRDPRLAALARIGRAPTPVVSVYLNTSWADEQQRERVRVFLKNGLAAARRGPDPRPAPADLDWIEAEGLALIAQERFPDARGVALFACEGLGLRETLAVRVPFEDAFVVGEAPHLGPLAALGEEARSALVLFVDAESARLVPLTAEGPGEEVALEHEVPGRHSRGGWAQLAQSRYQRHIHDHRARHFEAVAEALEAVARAEGAERIVLAGEPRNLAVFRRSLPAALEARIVGTMGGARHEATSAIVGRAADLLARRAGQEASVEVSAVLTEAAKGGRAVAGIAGTLEAVTRGAVHRLYLHRGFREPGRVCAGCGALGPGPEGPCAGCGAEARLADLGEAMVQQVMAAGGTVEMVDAHRGLEGSGGVAAALRYPLGPAG